MSRHRDFLPYGRQDIGDDDVAAVERVLRSDFLTTGPATREFETAFAAAVGAAHAVACANGTAALHLASLAIELGPDDLAVVPSVTFLATANAPRLCGAEIRFADVDPDTGLMQPEHLEAALKAAGGKAKAVFPIHLNGQCGDSVGIEALARKHGLAIIEDACHALGGSYGGPDGAAFRIGACGHADMASFSFHPVKTIAMGEGGAITTNDAALAERMARLRNHGMTRDPETFSERDQAFDGAGEPNPWYYEMHEPAFNYRASDIHCALGLSQLRKLDRAVERRRALAARYDALLEPLAPTVKPVARNAGCRAAWHLYVALIDFEALGIERADLIRRLRAQGIGTQVHYLPVHRQPYYRARYGAQQLPGADRYYARILSLPLHTRMEDGDVERVVEAIAAIVERG